MAEYPGTQFPVIYADGISSAAHGSETFKFYLARFDPDMEAADVSNHQVFAQVVFPTTGFIAAALFFERYLNRMIEQNHVSQEQVEAIRQIMPRD